MLGFLLVSLGHQSKGYPHNEDRSVSSFNVQRVHVVDRLNAHQKNNIDGTNSIHLPPDSPTFGE